jgi:hypothetical protein
MGAKFRVGRVVGKVANEQTDCQNFLSR